MDQTIEQTISNISTIEINEAVRKLTERDERAERNTGFSATTAGTKLTQSRLLDVTAGVKENLLNEKPRANTVDYKLHRVLLQLRPEVVALACLMPALNSVGLENTHRDAALAIGQALYTECWAAKLLVSEAKAGRMVKGVTERFASVKLRQAQAEKKAEAMGFKMEKWSRKMLAQAGQWGVNIILKTMGDVFELRDIPGEQEKLWTIKDEAMEGLQKIVDDAVFAAPVYQPRTERPADWTGFFQRIAEDARTTSSAALVRTPHKETVAAIKHAIRAGQMDRVMLAVNNLQSVPYKLNAWIKEVLAECDYRGITVKGVPAKVQPVTKRSTDAEWNAMSPADKVRRAAQIKMEKKRNRIAKAKRMKFEIDMKVANRLQLVDQFFTPMNLDWRGRMYFFTHFNFQREDYVRGMFLFSRGKPVGERGIYHLKLHVANTGDFGKVSKKTMEERIAWTEANIDLIKDYVARPLYNLGWTEADKPFAFLAAARELVQALDKGPTYVCHLPVAFDGSCNGLQHLCAMTRAPEGKHVNLTDNEFPEDVYQLVADHALKLIEADKHSFTLFYSQAPGEPERKANATLGDLAQLVLTYGVDRKLVKRNVMTFAYSSKENGMKDQHVEDTIEKEALAGNYPFGTTFAEQQLAAAYLAKRVMAAIKTIVSKPAEAMAFMQKLAQVLAHEGKPLTWVTPAGLPWINRYHAPIVERVRLFCYDKGANVRIDMNIADGFEAPIEKRSVSNGVAPNFVHALDGCHLQLSINASVERGIVDIATVHDSFGCLPADADLFNEVIREEFLKLYTEHDVLGELLDSAKASLSPAGLERLEKELAKAPMPERGKLDLEEILTARYAFA